MKPASMKDLSRIVLGCLILSSTSCDALLPDVNAPPEPSFTSLKSQSDPRLFTFTSTATDPDGGRIIAFRWNFGDNSEGDGPEAVHQYAVRGVFFVTLTVTDDDGVAASTTPRRITAGLNDPPIIVLSTVPTPAVGPAPLDVMFDASHSEDLDGTIVAYEWDFMDGQTASGARVTHTFDFSGIYRVRLSVRDDFGSESTARVEVIAE